MAYKQPNGVYMDQNYNLHYPPGASQLDGFPDELRSVVHEHWGTFPPQHPLIIDLIGLVFFLLFAIAVVGNTLVIYVFMSNKAIRTPTNMFIVNLAIADLGTITTQGLPVSLNVVLDNHFMYGVLMCKVYAITGGIFGTCALVTMVVIGYDRYNVIVKGFSGTKITAGKAALILMVIWVYSTLGSLPPILFGWGGYALEGMLITCAYDYLSEDWSHRSFILYAFTVNFCIPMTTILYFYTQIVKAVVTHEASLRAQAKKMNVESLRSNVDSNAQSAEMRIAKVAITNVVLWIVTWCPYASIVMTAAFGNRALITPMVSQIPSFLAKTACCLNPFVFAISHPKFREVLSGKFPCFGIREEASDNATHAQTIKTESA